MQRPYYEEDHEMLEIPIAITVGPAKADAPLMSGSTVNGVPPISFQESLDASARNHTTLTKFTVVSPHAIQDEKISALHGAMHSEESMPGFCLAVDANTSTEAGECTGAPNQYSREREGDFPANDGASKNDSQPEAVEDLNQVNKPSVTGLNAANAHGVGVYKQLGLTSSNCGPRIVIVQKTNAKGDMKIAKDKSEVKKLTANAGSSGETPLVTPSVAAVEEMQRGSIATIQSVPVMIPQQGPPTIDKASNDVPTGGVSDSHRTASIEKRSAPLRGDFSVKERITNTEQTVVEGNRVSHSRIESSQEQDGVQPSSGAMNPLFHQRMDGASSSRAGQDSSPAMLPVINGPSHMLTHSSPDRVHVLSGSTHAEMTSTEVASAGSSAITTGEEHSG
jgi:hypothetical protein